MIRHHSSTLQSPDQADKDPRLYLGRMDHLTTDCYDNIPESNLLSDSKDSNLISNLILIFSIAMFCQLTVLCFHRPRNNILLACS